MPPEIPSLAAKPATEQPAKADVTEKPDPAAAAQPEKPQRPDGFGDSLASYWNDEKGADFKKLTEDFTALSALKAETDSRLAQVPADVNEYEVALPADFQTPEGMTFEALKDHPALGPAREFAKKHGLTKDGFKELVALQAQSQIAEAQQLKTASEAERTKLGSKAGARIDAVTAWMTATLGNEAANALLPMLFSAKQVEAFEKIMAVAKAGGAKINGGGREVTTPTGITEAEWAKMSPQAKLEWGRKPENQRRNAS